MLAYDVEINLKPILNIIYYIAYIHIILFCQIMIYQLYYFMISSIPKCFVNCFNNNVCNSRHNVISSVTGLIEGGKYYTVESNQLMPFLKHSNLQLFNEDSGFEYVKHIHVNESHQYSENKDFVICQMSLQYLVQTIPLTAISSVAI